MVQRNRCDAVMSEVGHEETNAAQSFLVRSTAVSGPSGGGAHGLLSAISGHNRSFLFQHLIGALKETFRDAQAKLPGGFEIDYKFELAR